MDAICLSFIDERTGVWTCQDRQLVKKGEFYCGTTDHLTSFALLLGAGAGSSNASFYNGTIAWISLGFLCTAGIIILVAVVLNEGVYKIRKYRRQSVLLKAKFMESSK